MKRVLSLLPSTTEIIYMLGAEEHLVGVTHECDYPAAALDKPRVTGARINASMPSETIDALVREQLDESGSLYTLDMELVERIRPELVLTQQLCTVCAVGFATVRAAMRSLPDPPVVMNIEPRTIEEVLQSFIEVGAELGVAQAAEQRVAELRARLASIPPIAPAPTVLFLEWLIPPFSAGHWMAELVEAAGGRPILHNKGEHSRQLAWDTIRATPFDVLVISCCGFPVSRTLEDLRLSRELQQLAAERTGLRIILFDGNHFFSRPGPRLVESAELLNAALLGRAPEASGSTVRSPYLEIDPRSFASE